MLESFAELVEQVRTRSLQEKEELKFLLEREIIEDERNRIAVDHRQSEKELKAGKLKFSSSIAQLKKSLHS
jgi:hypothetical protein